MAKFPSLYQVNTRVYLYELGEALGRAATLDDVPDATLDEWSRLGFDWIWMLGVWQTGEAGQLMSASHPAWKQHFREALPNLEDADICGSPFAVQDYHVHEHFGGDAELARFRQRLRGRGMRLLLDFVPNHTALDHLWVFEHPEYYVRVATDDPERAHKPQNYITLATNAGPQVFAHGRDPYFDGWADTAQLNYRHGGFRQAMLAELARIATQCDGVRCDMAMLLLPDVIERTWGEDAHPVDGTPAVNECFWPEAIAAVRRASPQFVFMAEVYWGREFELQQMGFDYTYDKELYDRLHRHDAAAVRGHLHAAPDFQTRSVRFLENHDEPRAAAVFPPAVHQAAAVVTHLVPGLRFFHDGELDGRTFRTNIHLRRRRPEVVDTACRGFYERLLALLRRPGVRDGDWQLLDCRSAWDGNPTWNHFVAFWWQSTGEHPLLAAVNFGPTQGQCYVSVPLQTGHECSVRLHDLLHDVHYERSSSEVARGLYLDLPHWGFHAFEVVANC